MTQVLIFLILIIIGIYFFKTSKKEIREIGAVKKDLENQVDEKTKKLNASLKIFGENVISLKFDTYGVITYASPAFCQTSCYTLEELLGKPSSHFTKSIMSNLQNRRIWTGEVKRV